MSVASNNPFALLSEEGRKSAAGSSAGAPKAKPSTSKPATTTSTSTTRAGAEASARPRRDPSTRVIQPSELLAAEPSTPGRSGRGARSGRGGRGRGRGRDRDALDRRSRTGLHDSAKKIDQGWGKPVESSLKADEEKTDATKKEGEEGSDATPKAEGEEAVAAEATPEEPEDKTMTLEEYRKAQATSDSLAAQPQRKPNSADQEWENAVLLDRDQEEYSMGKGTGKSGRAKSQKVKTQIAIEQRFHAPRRGGFRDDKPQGGAGRGGRGRGGNRSNINVQDERAFPSLGA
ncbi:hypothetical protein H4R35_002426 [Dimargaris xerosporica]|nr:hypothetical protein H4R35_002426 [Dimargaris xerosporica]